MANQLAIHETGIPGLLLLDLPLHGDGRGWFKENWQRAKMIGLGLPDFAPVQSNMSFNAAAGSTRGMHAEPWDKLISLASGRIFGAWIDLRAGAGFGTSFTVEIGPDQAVFVPRGVANGYQALEPGTVYSYLVNEHWSPEVKDSYTYVNLADETVAIPWPIPLEQAALSQADLAHPRLAEVAPVSPKKTVIIGADGQLGRALVQALPDAVALTRHDLDLTNEASVDAIGWSQVGLIINAAAYTGVDAAETVSGRRECWAVNVTGLSRLVERARANRIGLVHVSSDYVFDGEQELHHVDEPLAPLSVYGQTKAAGEALVASLPRHWIVRTSWVIGDGANFVKTMARLADTGGSPGVVGDQFGRLTFTPDLAAGIVHLVNTAPRGIYHVTNDGPSQSWAEIAREVFELRGRRPADVVDITSAQYAPGKLVAPRPKHSTLALDKTLAAGFRPQLAKDRLAEYLDGLAPTPAQAS